MNAAEFRKLALACEGASESEHNGHPDFRVGGRIFASLAADGSWAMVKVSPLDQATLIERSDGVMEPFPGAWGKQGCTKILLAKAAATLVREAVVAAHGHISTGPDRVKAKSNPNDPPGKKKS